MELLSLLTGDLSYRKGGFFKVQERLHYTPDEGVVQIDLSHLMLEEKEELDTLRQTLEEILSPLGKKVYGVMNVEGFRVKDELKNGYGLLLRDLYSYYLLDLISYRSNAIVHEGGGEPFMKTFRDRKEALTAVKELKEERSS